MDDQPNPKQQLIDRLKVSNNILVTVSADPSVDQLAACIGLTLMLNKLNKHATAVFSGEVPSTLEFLQPEATLEKNTDSLRDFIIALDKSKADKLRYKVEDRVVKIFITPFRTSLSADDLEFSQGDFNVDLVVALGVREQEDLDNAITAHGRILHDATVATVNTQPDGGLGTINWHDTQTSSLCELIADISRSLGPDLLDSQIATALLTGIVAETSRFSNEKTTSQTMSVSAELMSAGANQQLVATKLEGPSVDLKHSEARDKNKTSKDNTPGQTSDSDNGTLEITHAQKPKEPKEPSEEPSTEDESKQPEPANPEKSAEKPVQDDSKNQVSPSVLKVKGPKLVTEPPTMGGTLTANSQPEGLDPSIDPLGSALPETEEPLLSHDSRPASSVDSTTEPPKPGLPEQVLPEPQPPAEPTAPPLPLPQLDDNVVQPPVTMDDQNQALTEAGQTQNTPSPEPENTVSDSGISAARDEVVKALNSSPPGPEPIQALNAQPMDLDLHTNDNLTPQNPPVTAFNPANFNMVNDEPAIGAQPPLVPNNAQLPQSPPLDYPLPPSPTPLVPYTAPNPTDAFTASAPLPNLTPPIAPASPAPDASAPPPVPPPLTPPGFMTPPPTQ
ncbi:MAG TPA: hypothetical protein VLG37_04500 [Candidatus Saccharimonadales bacterium]|nr:hypothetical protein [Candidatus Saccharimonadales bacterium]